MKKVGSRSGFRKLRISDFQSLLEYSYDVPFINFFSTMSKPIC